MKSKRPLAHRAASCDGKIRWETRAQAIAARLRTGPLHKMTSEVYHCRFCGFFHWGHSRSRRWPK